MPTLFEQYAAILPAISDPMDKRLLIERHDDLEVFYSPFDHVNLDARIVLIGITPGHYQAEMALKTASDVIRSGASNIDAARKAKETASFSGPMRSNLVAMLDYFQINAVLGIASCASLFDVDAHLVHYTSALRYPVYRNGKNYSGAPSMTSHPFLRKHLLAWFAEEMRLLPNAIFVPLGAKVAEAVTYVAKEIGVPEHGLLTGIQHPSGANAERIAYLLERKSRSSLSQKTNPSVIDAARTNLQKKIRLLQTA